MAAERQDDARWRHRGVLIGVLIAAAGTVVNKALGLEPAGRAIVLVGGTLALIALWRPAWLAGRGRGRRR
ncbi:MAG TPA: hypothetical protein PLL30_12505 [Candidatus Krumholzibacteria bacterium]|nr:hypothetical protein [Candidatus Krumholzibacteria bacterium]HPD72590.1 hypothetical protein [Candidatus Krumholzibacteria bacterium]HRY40478.1 hypothetical protein [Candidatus Krumholzibacteria bacterium]